eukprot:scpid78258/ scgid28611/ 
MSGRPPIVTVEWRLHSDKKVDGILGSLHDMRKLHRSGQAVKHSHFGSYAGNYPRAWHAGNSRWLYATCMYCFIVMTKSYWSHRHLIFVYSLTLGFFQLVCDVVCVF